MYLMFLVNAVVAAGFLLHAFVAGYAIFCLLRGEDKISVGTKNNCYLTAFFSLSLGISGNLLMLMMLGFCGLLEPLSVSLVAVGVFCVAIFALRKQLNLVPNVSFTGIAWILLIFLLTLVFAFQPPGHWDDTSFHLPLARFYLEHQAIELHEYVRFPLFPQNMNMLFVLGLMIGDAYTAQVFATLPWFVIALGLIGFCMWQVGSSLLGGVVAIALIKWVGVFKVGFGYAYVDTGLAMLCWAATLAYVFFYEQYGDTKINPTMWVSIAGLLAGAAAGTKLFGGVLSFIIFLHLLIISRNVKLAILYCSSVLLLGVWWYLRSFIISGDPFHPAGGRYFGYFLWNEDDLISQINAQNSLGTSADLLELFNVLEKMGTELWGLAFIGVFLRHVPKTIRVMQLIFLAYFFFWFFVAQIDRYLAPIVVVATFLSVYTVYFLLSRFLNNFDLPKIKSRIVIVGAHCLILAYGGNIFVKEFQSRTSESWSEKLLQVQGYELFTKANEFAINSQSRLVQLGFENAAYFFRGLAIGDWFGSARYSQMLDCSSRPCAVIDEQRLEQLLINFDSELLIVSLLRYPDFDPQNYLSSFDLILTNSQGVLLRLKSNRQSVSARP